MREIIVMTATLVLLAFASRAEDVAVPPPPGANWSPALREALFSDEATMTLRDEADARSRFEALAPEDQAMLRAECEAGRSDETVTTGAPADDAASDPAPSDPAAPPEFDSAGTGAEGSPVPAGAVSLSHVVQICGWVLDPAQPTP